MRRYVNYPTKKKIETSKLLLIIAIIFVIIICVVGSIATFVLQDPAPLEYMIGGSFTLASTAYGFYYWKAKAENLHKYNRDDEIRGE